MGRDYPKAQVKFEKRFVTEEAYLAMLIMATCRGVKAWIVGRLRNKIFLWVFSDNDTLARVKTRLFLEGIRADFGKTESRDQEQR